MSTNPPEEQAVYQRVHRTRKQAKGLCAENGCQNETNGAYRCPLCRRLHVDYEKARRARKRMTR